jgi:DNA-binding transcriptional ArsR family regulator
MSSLIRFPIWWMLMGRLASYIRQIASEPGGASASMVLDPSFKRMMVYVFVGTRGGQNRARIVELIRTEPANPNKISEKLGLDYKTVQHHIKLLEENGVIVASSKGTYGAVYFLTPYFEKFFDSVKSMWARFGQS